MLFELSKLKASISSFSFLGTRMQERGSVPRRLMAFNLQGHVIDSLDY